jgi:hypothetical protein
MLIRTRFHTPSRTRLPGLSGIRLVGLGRIGLRRLGCIRRPRPAATAQPLLNAPLHVLDLVDAANQHCSATQRQPELVISEQEAADTICRTLLPAIARSPVRRPIQRPAGRIWETIQHHIQNLAKSQALTFQSAFCGIWG